MKRVIMVIMVLFVATGMAMAIDMTVGAEDNASINGLSLMLDFEINQIFALGFNFNFNDTRFPAAYIESLSPISFALSIDYLYAINESWSLRSGIDVGFSSETLTAENGVSASTGYIYSINPTLTVAIDYTFDFGLVLGGGAAFGYAFPVGMPNNWSVIEDNIIIAPIALIAWEFNL